MAVTKMGSKLDAALILCLCCSSGIWAGLDGSTAGWITVIGSAVVAVCTVLTLVERLRSVRDGDL